MNFETSLDEHFDTYRYYIFRGNKKFDRFVSRFFVFELIISVHHCTHVHVAFNQSNALLPSRNAFIMNIVCIIARCTFGAKIWQNYSEKLGILGNSNSPGAMSNFLVDQESASNFGLSMFSRPKLIITCRVIASDPKYQLNRDSQKCRNVHSLTQKFQLDPKFAIRVYVSPQNHERRRFQIRTHRRICAR